LLVGRPRIRIKSFTARTETDLICFSFLFFFLVSLFKKGMLLLFITNQTRIGPNKLNRKTLIIIVHTKNLVFKTYW